MKEFTQKVIQSFFMITTVCLFGSALFITLLFPNDTLDVRILWQVLICGLILSPLSYIFYSSRELSKKAILIRQVIHYIVLNITFLLYAYWVNWIDISNTIQVLTISFLNLIGYIAVRLTCFADDKKEAQKLNAKILEYQGRKDS